MRKLSDTYWQHFEFLDTPMEKHLAAVWARVNANWGLLEYRLWQIMADVNPTNAHEWTLDFFASGLEKAQLVTRELKLLTSGDQDLMAALDKGLTQIEMAKKIRNSLIHGLWYRENEKIKVQPLRLSDQNEFSIENELIVDSKLLSELEKRMRSADQILSTVGSERLAFSELYKMDRRRHP